MMMIDTDHAVSSPLVLGPVRVVLTGTELPGSAARGPTIDDARRALDRVMRVTGADAVLAASADYRRAAQAGGGQLVTASAWGVAIRNR